MAAWTATTLLLLCPLVHASLPWTPCSYAILRDRGLPETFNTVPSPHEMYAAQAKCDAMGPSCGGFSMIGAASYFKKPFAVANLTGAPSGALLYMKNCGPWQELAVPVWPLQASASTAGTPGPISLAPGFVMSSESTSALLRRAFDRYSALIFDHDVDGSPAATPALSNLTVTVSDDAINQTLGVDESYNLTVPGAGCSECTVSLAAHTVTGALRGLETFAQLVRFNFESETYYIDSAPIVINDKPRFAYRGIMLDVARHFFPLPALRQVVDAMAFSKFNVLHLHLSDSQSFPVVSKLNPRLSQAAFSPIEKYTLRDLARLDSYATDRGVLVIPEFDSPGHGGAWCQGYPSLCPSANCTLPMDPSNNLTYSVIQNLVIEMRETFRSGIYHGGGDEVDYSCWESTPRIKAWMTKNGLTGEGAYSYFLHQVAGMASPGAPMFWQDAAEKEMPATPLPKDSIIEYYKAGPIAATSQKYRVVYADNGKWGLDIHTSEKMWEAFYTVDPTVEIGHGLNEANLLGGESAVWTVTTDASILSPVLWPRLLAVGEKLWSPMADTATVTTSNAAARMAWARCELNRRGIPAASSLSSLTPAEVGLYGSCLLQ